ncbi:alpha/beta-hydrolase [Decorospora gaudefroyi]|uniref:Alpha/beta-hydrolase n=1 Tax=Decorospora gaudefroyi TaxID=184978 RepID=A0A6A5KN74_9PLEO|nr:alpha/beta-hydrolase [Decorospora gaudefroyi]
MKNLNGSDADAATAPVKPRRRTQGWRALSATFVTLACLAAVDTIFPELKNWDPSSLKSQPAASYAAFEWSEASPSKRLKFHKCFDGFECAKLSLPFDYFNGTYPNHTVNIAIVKLAARVPVDNPRHGGPILLNPGGPGGSGATFALGVGKAFQTVVDPSVDPRLASGDAKYFDIIGFDPRGIGWSEPAARCMPDQPSSWSWNLREENEGLVESSDAALGRLWSMTHAFGASCKLAEDDHDGPDIKQYMSTASVARDMLEITERHEEWVATEVARLAAQKVGKRLGGDYNITYSTAEAKLQYWGFSYGTYLGSTFASMFPDRVGRLVLDGVVSPYDYRHGLGNGSLTDTEKAMNSFYTYCHYVGPDQCPLATANSTVAAIEERTQGIVQSLYHNPLPIVSPEGPDFLTWSNVKIMLFAAMYTPQPMFEYIGEILADIEAGGGQYIDELTQAARYTHVYSCAANGSVESSLLTSFIVANSAVLCSDGVEQNHITRDEFYAHWKLQDALSPTGGSYWSMLLMRCTAWKIRAMHKFEGPFGGNTSHPILFISNTADPVSPLRNGRDMRDLFADSELLVADHAGHCSVSLPDPCVLARVRTYFQTGELPAPGTLCVPPSGPFSLNSTDPESPFYDPSLGSANVVLQELLDVDGEQGKLWDMGSDLMKGIVESGLFAFEMMGGRMERAGRQIAAR